MGLSFHRMRRAEVAEKPAAPVPAPVEEKPKASKKKADAPAEPKTPVADAADL